VGAVRAEYAEMIYSGQWFSPLRAALDGFVEATQERISPAIIPVTKVR
jgi:argininosuccinate synthase